jgi:hypothetical protein
MTLYITEKQGVGRAVATFKSLSLIPFLQALLTLQVVKSPLPKGGWRHFFARWATAQNSLSETSLIRSHRTNAPTPPEQNRGQRSRPAPSLSINE